MAKKYELPEESFDNAQEPIGMVSEPVMAYAHPGAISTTDALWALIANQARDVQMAIKNRLDRLFTTNEYLRPYTMEELNARIDEAELQLEKGDVIPGEDVHRMMREYIESLDV